MPNHPMLRRHALVLHRPGTERGVRIEYPVLDERGERMGAVIATRPALLGSRLRLVAADVPLLPVTVALQDESRASVLHMYKPWGRMLTHVALADGTPLGCVRRRWRLGKSRFELVRDDKRVGVVRAHDWRATEFTLVDESGGKLGSAERWRGGGSADSVPADADQYLIRIAEGAHEPLRSFALGAVLALEAVVPHSDRSTSGAASSEGE